MRRRMIMGLLALGVIGGYGSGIAHMCHAGKWREQHRQQVMGEFARTCVEAARTPAGQNQPSAFAQPVVAPPR